MTYGLLDIAKDAIQGQLLYVTDDIKHQRLDICKQCEHLVTPFIPCYEVGTCGVCNCLLQSKASFTRSSCPKLKW